MKNIFTALFMLSFTLMFSQDVVEEKQNKYGFEVTAKFGSSKLDLKDAVDLNGSFSAGDFLFVYRLNENSTLKSGVTLAEFNSNFTSLGETASLKNTYLQVPLKYFYATLLTNNALNNSKINMLFGIGINANHLYKSEVETTLSTSSDKNLGWNFGSSFEMGLDFTFSKYMNFGIFYEAMSDITRIKKDDINQKLVSTNLVKFSYILNF